MRHPCSPISCIRSVAVVAGLVCLAGCQTDNRPDVSLEEAKHITATFEGAFTPPPRTIQDIVALIDASEQPVLACNFVLRQTDEDIRNTEKSIPVIPQRISYLTSQASEQFYSGNYRRSIRLMKWAADAVPPESRGGAAVLSELASYQAHGGRLDEAKNTLEEAIQLQSSIRQWGGSKYSLTWLNFHVSESRGAIAAAEGQLALAEIYYRKAIDILDNAEAPMRQQPRFRFAKLSLARTLASQGRLLEAENIIREVLEENLPHITQVIAIAMLRYGEVLYDQGRYAEAETIARTTIRTFEALCTVSENIQLSQARHLLAKTLVAQERWQQALDQYDAIHVAMNNDIDLYYRLYSGTLYKGLAMLRTGRTDEAIRDLAGVLRRTEERLGSKHYRAAEIRGFLAMAKLQKGATAQALEDFRAVTRILLTRSRESDDESNSFKARDQRLTLILESYMGLLADIRGTAVEKRAGIDAVSESFRLAEVARSRGILRALAASGSRAVVGDPALADLARREQDAHKQITALYGTLAAEYTRPPGERKPGRIEDLKVSIDRLRGARAALMEEIERRFPSYADLINPRPATITRARQVLRPGEALIATYVGEDRTHIWAVPRDGKVAYAAVPLGRDRLSAAVRQLRRALDPQAVTLGDIPPFDVAAAHRLYSALLAPVEEGWKDAGSLLAVANGPLGQLPLSVLVSEATTPGAGKEPLFSNYRRVPFLARSHAVTVVPSVSSLITLRGLPAGSPIRRDFAGFGDPWFSERQAREAVASAVPARTAALISRGLLRVRGLPVHLRAAPRLDGVSSADLAKLPRLPDTADEVRGIALAMNADPTRDVFTGKDASEGRVKRMNLSGYRVLAFATHGLVPGDLNGLTQPALALSSPKVTGGKDDGLLTMGEILGLKLDADWVVLSACNTASGEGAGAEAVSGLGRAFFYAGTRALLVSNWPVETTSARALTTDIFRRQAGDPGLARAEALRRSMIALIDGPGFRDARGRTVFSYAHPIFWAPFSLVGDGGGGRPAG